MTGRSWHRFGAGMVDQGLSSATNFVVAVLAARKLSPDDFGEFSLLVALYVIGLAAARSTSAPLLVRMSGTSRQAKSAAMRQALGTAVVIGLVLSCVSVLAGAARGTSMGPFALAAVMPGLLCQDAGRYCLIADRRPWSAAANDLVWLVAELPVLFVLGARGTATSFVLGWGFVGSVCALAITFQLRAAPAVSQWRRWLTIHGDLIPQYLVRTLSVMGWIQFGVVALSIGRGTAEAGAYRGVTLLFGPVMVAMVGLTMVATAEGADRGASPQRLMALARGISIFAFAMAGAMAGALMLIPESVGNELLGETWTAARELVPPFGVAVVAAGLSSGPEAALQALGEATSVMKLGLVSAVVSVGAIAVVASPWGALGVTWAQAFVLLAVAPAFWMALTGRLAAVRARPAPPPESHANDGEDRQLGEARPSR
jgi:O-antigen/teichoic acid export membrane protein